MESGAEPEPPSNNINCATEEHNKSYTVYNISHKCSQKKIPKM